MNYIEVDFTIDPINADNREILAAMLGEVNFESFIDTPQGLKAYIQEPLFDMSQMQEAILPLNSFFEKMSFICNNIAQQNWNEAWEKSFDPIFIGNDCCIRAPFHSIDKTFKYDLIIEPKMSFGTGHHNTTRLMVELMLNINFDNQLVLDMGCGTGVLAILAAMLKAQKVWAVDIDEWSFENTTENIERNGNLNIEPILGDASVLPTLRFNTILANINRNILLKDMSIYYHCLEENGCLILSGFYVHDLPLISEKAEQLGLKYQQHIENDQWVAAKYFKPTNQ